MAFDNPTRNRLNSFVAECRNILSEEFTSQLKRDYGMDPDSGAVTDIEKLTQLDDARRETARILRDTLQHYVAGSTAESKKARQEAMRRIIREQAFTVLNRLCALRMAEARKLFIESVGNGLQSQGFQLYARLAGTALGETSDAYRCYLYSVFDELAVDLAVLFNRFSPEGRLFPPGTVLQEILGKLNAPEMVPLWEEDETIGWIYQYFNDPAERKKMRDESAAPRNSRELAVRNQFFTPRYVVEFLTDNTLGRIWYEMTQGQTSLKESCRYMVRRPDEVFLGRESTEPLSSTSSLGIPARASSSPAETTKPPAKKSAKAAAAAKVAAAKTEEGTGRNAHPTTVADLLLTGTEETFPEFSAATDDCIQRMIELAHGVDGYVRHANEEESRQWLEELKRQHLESMQYEGLATQDILDALFLTCRADRHGGDGTVYKERWFAAACNEVRRRVLNSRRTDLSQEELLKQPVFIPYRAMKDPREIRMLDPACGSMHFGLYAFDLFEQIYQEYWTLSEQGNALSLLPRLGGEGGRRPDEGALLQLREIYGTAQAFQAAIPKLIIEHNIHGIDIDRRATQIAGLSLWLRAQKSWQKQKVKPQDRPRIVRSNIVCAEPMPGNSELLEEFLQKHLSSDAEGQLLTVLVRKVFEAMKLAGEAGSLLKIEEEIAGEVEKARQLWDKSREKKQQSLFDNRPKQVQQEMHFVRKIDDATFWDEAENLIYAALRAYAEQAENGGGFQRRLFAEDAARGFAFIDVCRTRYDVVLMNPPFGEFSIRFREVVQGTFVSGNLEMLAAFVERGLELGGETGLLGAITSRTAFFQTTMAEWRQQKIIPSGVICWLELGMGVLDAAMVETVMYVLGARNGRHSLFIGPKSGNFLESLSAARVPIAEVKDIHLVETTNFNAIGGAPFAYWLSTQFFDSIRQLPSLEDSGMSVRVGLQTGDDFRFVRAWWEVLATDLRSDSRERRSWVAHAKGGDNSPYFVDIHLVVNWADDGREISSHPSAVTRSSQYYLHPGLTFSYRTHRFSPALLPRLCITGVAGMGVFTEQHDLQFAVAFLNSSLVNAFISARLGLLEINALYQAGTVSPTPFPSFALESKKSLAAIGIAQVRGFQTAAKLDEASRSFAGFDLLAEACNFRTIVDRRIQFAADITASLVEGYRNCDRVVSAAYGFAVSDIEPVLRKGTSVFNRSLPQSPPNIEDVGTELSAYFAGCAFGRWDIRHATGEQAAPELSDPFAPLPVCPPGQLQNAQGLPARPEDVPENYPIQIPGDGILVDDPGHALDIERRVREVIEIIWRERVGSRQLAVGSEGKKHGGTGAETLAAPWATPEAIEQEACEILGVRSLREYFAKPAKFFADHLKRYSKSRRQAPIYWPLSTESGGYTLWIYYHRLTDQTLFHAVNNFVEPKLKQVTEELGRLKAKSGRSSAEEKELSKLTELASELTDFRDELLRVAKFWKPNLNDGVLITASPLWKLFRLPKWRKDLKACWDELDNGDYDWAHLALSIWPDRVVRTAHKDRSIAIAHDLESDLWHEVTVTKPGKGKNAKPTTKTEWQPQKLSEAELDKIAKRKT